MCIGEGVFATRLLRPLELFEFGGIQVDASTRWKRGSKYRGGESGGVIVDGHPSLCSEYPKYCWPGVYVNETAVGAEPNCIFATLSKKDQRWLRKEAGNPVYLPSTHYAIVVLKDIQPGEELTIDYGCTDRRHHYYSYNTPKLRMIEESVDRKANCVAAKAKKKLMKRMRCLNFKKINNNNSYH